MHFNFGIDRLDTSIAMSLAHRSRAGNIDQCNAKVDQSRSVVELMAAGNTPVYGVNTGFGPLCDTLISPEETDRLQENLLISHAVGVGKPIDPELSKLMIICKIHALAQGYSGVRKEVIERLLFFLEKDLIPVVPEQGSVGASGDLAPLSHLSLPLIGHGRFWRGDEQVSARSVHETQGLTPLSLKAKEGLALINGTQFILAHTIKGLDQMSYLLDLADVAGAMSLEGLQGSAAPYRPELHKRRPYRGSIEVARRMTLLLSQSENMSAHANCTRVQDPYSIRCIPQVHGASRNAEQHLSELAEIEMNSVTDNPIIVSASEAISGGNFHGQPLAMAIDYTSIAASELGNISDRRSYLLLDGKFGLPRMLTQREGLNSGLMIAQYTTAALVSENKSLCFPASSDSIPTSMGQEDHVSMGSISGRKFNQILENSEKILAIELLIASQAISFRRPLRCSTLIEENMKIIRREIPVIESDRLIQHDIQAMMKLVKERKLIVNF